MIIECSNCETRFRLEESSIKGSGVKVKCTKCQNVFVVAKPEAPEDQVAPVSEDLKSSTDSGAGDTPTQEEAPAASEPPIDETPDEEPPIDDITDPTTWGLLDRRRPTHEPPSRRNPG